jgi:hypothetical protein
VIDGGLQGSNRPPVGDVAFATGIIEIDERVFRFHFAANLKLIWSVFALGN